MIDVELNTCELPVKVWNWLTERKSEQEIVSLLQEETQCWLRKQGTPLSAPLIDLIEEFSSTTTRALISENDIVEAIRLGLSVFLETAFDHLFESDDDLIATITTTLCNWFNKETGGNISADISYA